MDINSQAVPNAEPILHKKVLTKHVTTRNLRYVIDRLSFHRLNRLADKHLHARGHKMAVFANEHIGGFIHVFGVHEQEELDVLFSFLEPLRDLFRAGMALDIGANIGNHSLYFSRIFNSVQCFEPDPSTFYLLQFNVSFKKNVIAYNIGLGDKKGTFRLSEVPKNMGASVIVTDQIEAEAGAECVNVQVDRLDDLDYRDQGPCFIKMDVEGFEPKVLKGGLRTITKHWPLIVLEQHESDFKEGSSESISILKNLGYEFCWHQSGVRSRNALVRRLFNIKEMFIGRTHKVITSESVPSGNYSMLIAVPPRFQGLLRI
ncbi:FkbM family methyltransferase [Paraburkholderia sp. LEh10]|uniref:FkbM family methyltransferase n=1 Tax=Paraburkholderia sp. LEh10 TaxID=2821353 RepID=UPI001AEA89F3|nr:FkbM family methyltransferase [Paraburkholderia sp. LEh10]MBP0594412.1 FkbM family methyltransferase [Paraburkholderia sp. LEh10]